jgi:outer membrane usher protein
VDGNVVRGQTNLTVDDPERLRRWVVGDSYVSGGTLGGSLYLAGVSVARNFGLDPYFMRYPTLGMSGAVVTPSTAEIYVNGTLVGREQLRPGEFSFANLVVPSGSGAAEVVIRDAFGQERVITEPFYAATALLRRGVSEYAYGLGASRENGAAGGNDYGSLAFLGRHRLGITDGLTGEVRLEGDEDLVSGGASAAAGVLGAEAEAGLAASSGNGRDGSAGFVSFRYVGRPLSLGAFICHASEGYRTLSQVADESPPRLERSLSMGAQLGRRTSLTGLYSDESRHDGEERVRAAVLASIRVGARTSLVASLSRSRLEGTWATVWFVSLNSFLGTTTTASLSYERTSEGGKAMADVLKSPPLGVGYGYRAGAVAADGEVDGDLSAEYQGPFGRYTAGYQHSAGSDALSAGFSGGIIALGGLVRPSRAVRDAFALIRIPGLAGVDGTWSNQSIGTTDRRGDLIVPTCFPIRPTGSASTTGRSARLGGARQRAGGRCRAAAVRWSSSRPPPPCGDRLAAGRRPRAGRRSRVRHLDGPGRRRGVRLADRQARGVLSGGPAGRRARGRGGIRRGTVYLLARGTRYA